MRNIKVLGLLAVAAFAGFSHASIIINPTAANDGGSGYPGDDSISSATATINGSGLSNASLVGNGSPIPASYPTVTPNANGFTDNYDTNSTIGTSPPGVVITYTLDQKYTVTGGHFWQYSGDREGSGERSLKSADIYVSTDAGATYVPAGSLTNLPVEGTYGTPTSGLDFSLNGSFAGVNAIQLRNLDAPGDPNITAAFNEIRFIGTVPEPASMSLLGMGALGLLARRRRI